MKLLFSALFDLIFGKGIDLSGGQGPSDPHRAAFVLFTAR
ncbi:MAG: hypothetical protein QOE88_318 [Verrucomicrobiota bacterium]|jgi:hypothetical protein|nr:hypothetical protein [Verrucomicrobiota bacterium]MEA3162500.1 hypothetical protein [Verrucomicrobiota bacterium]